MEINQIINSWILKIQIENIPSPIKALHFGLYESGEFYILYLVGSIEFSTSNADWIFDTSYSPNSKYCEIASINESNKWNDVLQKVKTHLLEELSDPSIFPNVQFITCGFDNGDIFNLRNIE